MISIIFSTAKSQDKELFDEDTLISKEQIIALDSLKQRSQSNISVLWNYETGTPAYMIGGLTPKGYLMRGKSYEQTVYEFLLQNKTLFRLNSPSTELLLIKTKNDSEGNIHLLFNRTYKGLKVWNSQLAVHFDKEARITSINGRYHPSFDIPIDPSISQAQAIQICVRNLESDTVKQSQVELIIYPNQNELKLGWKVDVSTISFPKALFIIDAHSGEILFKDTGIRF